MFVTLNCAKLICIIGLFYFSALSTDLGNYVKVKADLWPIWATDLAQSTCLRTDGPFCVWLPIYRISVSLKRFLLRLRNICFKYMLNICYCPRVKSVYVLYSRKSGWKVEGIVSDPRFVALEAAKVGDSAF